MTIQSHACILLLILFSSCMDMNEEILPPGTGSTGDVLVVMDSIMWAGESGRAIMSCFAATQDGLPQREPYFNVIRVTPDNFAQLFKTTKNIILLEANKKHVPSKYGFQKNAWAKNQLVLTLFAKGDKTAGAIINNNCELLRDRFRNEEYKRLIHAYKSLQDQSVTSQVEEVCGMSLHFPSDYTIARKEDDQIWLRKDFQHQGHQINMGLIIYTKPYYSQEQFNTDSLVALRNEITKMVEGPNQGSYMTSYAEFPPISKELEINGKYVKEIRGLWNMKGAFMGGPFVQYTYTDTSGKAIIYIDCYVFAPKFDKREYLRELEAIALSALPI
ncbi:MAG: DUF4837 family protein [Vicingaceae bacterium]